MKKINTNEDLDLALQNELSVILSKTKDCSVCSAIKEKLILIKNNYPKVNFFELYLDDLPLFQGQFLVFSVPTVLIMNYNKELLRQSRFIQMRNITNFLDSFNS